MLGVPVSDVNTEGAPPFVVSPYGVVTNDAKPINFPGTPPRDIAVPPCQNAD